MNGKIGPYVGGHPIIPLHEYEPTGTGECAACLRPEASVIPVGAYVASALMAANYGGDSGEDVDRFLEELRRRGYEVTPTARRHE